MDRINERGTSNYHVADVRSGSYLKTLKATNKEKKSDEE